MKTNQVLGTLLLIEARKLLAAQGVELRCQHEIKVFDSALFEGAPFRYNPITANFYTHSESQAQNERAQIIEVLDSHLSSLGVYE